LAQPSCAEDNKQLTARLRKTHDLCHEHGDMATASLIENWIECGLLTGARSAEALWPAIMRTAPTGRTHGCTDQRRK
jgi:hypothetical protein